MFCHNCGFEINDQKLTECPECSSILSSSLSYRDNQEKEEIFQDIENILSNDEFSELYENTATEKDPEKEGPFDLDFATVCQDDPITKANNGKEKESSAFEEDDETGDEIESKKTSNFTFVLFFILPDNCFRSRSVLPQNKSA